MVKLGLANSRMKDFYDIAVLAKSFDFDGPLLATAIGATFTRRETALPTTPPVALSDAFTTDTSKLAQWSGFVRKAGIQEAGSLADTVAAVRAFVEAPLASARNATLAPASWRSGGPWT